jgi:hypothetical protein
MAEDLKIVCMPISHNLGKHSRATPLNGSMTDRKEATEEGHRILDSMQENSNINSSLNVNCLFPSPRVRTLSRQYRTRAESR